MLDFSSVGRLNSYFDTPSICEIGGILGGLGMLGGLGALGILGGLGIPNHIFLIVFDAFTKRSD
ncbi:MAG: hypothetical protein IKG83_02315 [Prevotella sp.]|nr:hypothetical protein [Prevotella sp.]